MFSFISGFIIGLLVFIFYGAYRAVNSDGWDDSNILNWLRLLSHTFIHPEDFGKMYYLDYKALSILKNNNYIIENMRPFDYISKDEFAENFPNSRP